MAKISACVIVRNEEKNIRRCLESLKGVVDDIFVIHDGDCLDKTIEIAREYSDNIFIRPFAGFMEAHFVFFLNRAKADWVLRIDADEFLSDELNGYLRKLTDTKDASSYEFIWPFWDDKKEITKNWPYKKCFFLRRDISFLGIPHFLPTVNGNTKKVNLVLRHRPNYNNFSFKIFFKKSFDWAKIQAEIYLKGFSEVEKFNYTSSDWPLIVKIRKRIPLLILPFDFFLGFFKTLIPGLLKGNFIFKISFLNGLYKAVVDYWIFIASIKNKN